jgi:arginase family enzyme
MSEKTFSRKLAFFGVALDPTDDELKLEFKTILAREFAAGRTRFRNPYEALTGALQDKIDAGLCVTCGEVEIASWLTPTPKSSDVPLLTAENNLRFVDEGGCHEAAERVQAFLASGPARGIPAMVSVDHSVTGGALRAFAERYGSSNTAVLVMDSHFDGLGLAERIELFRYSRGKEPDGSGMDPLDALGEGGEENAALQNGYNCATWLKHMLDERVVEPDRLIVFGISDYPTAAMRKDPRLSRYSGAYRTFEEAGVIFVTKEEIRRKGVRGTLAPLLKGMAADRLYVSLDADIGSLDAVHAARFMNAVGLNSEEMYEIARVIDGALEEKELIGFDVCGIETFLLGRQFPNGSTDRTLERLSDFIRLLLGREAKHSHRKPEEGRDPLAKGAEGIPLSRE